MVVIPTDIHHFDIRMGGGGWGWGMWYISLNPLRHANYLFYTFKKYATFAKY